MENKRTYEGDGASADLSKRIKTEPVHVGNGGSETRDQHLVNQQQNQNDSKSNDQDNDDALAHAADMAAATAAAAAVAEQETAMDSKLEHGSDEWHRIRKMNHKEVERRRRETINGAIKELQELVPTAHNNKAQVIRKAAETIRKMKEQEEATVNKWTLEKIITDQAIAELASSNEKLKTELEKAYREIEYHKSQFGKFIEVVKANGVNPAITEFLSKVEPFPADNNSNHHNTLDDDEEDEEDDDEEEEEDDDEEEEEINDNRENDNTNIDAQGESHANDTNEESNKHGSTSSNVKETKT